MLSQGKQPPDLLEYLADAAISQPFLQAILQSQLRIYTFQHCLRGIKIRLSGHIGSNDLHLSHLFHCSSAQSQYHC